MSFTSYCLGFATCFCLSATTARAQVITDTVQANAARDTLFHQATVLRTQAQQTTQSFTTNLKGLIQRRYIVKGRSEELPTNSANTVTLSKAARSVKWRHTTIYWYNGAVEERFKLIQAGRTVMREKRLNGAVTWLQLQPLLYKKSHSGYYLKEGYLMLDGKSYILPQGIQ